MQAYSQRKWVFIIIRKCVSGYAHNRAFPHFLHNNCIMQMYDRRKIAALEVESLVKSLVKEGKMSEVYDLVDLLAAKFALSSQVPFLLATT